MSDPLPSDEAPVEPGARPPDEPPAPASRWWVAALTFLGGLMLGVLTVALLNLSTPDFGAGYGAGGAPGSETARPTVPDEVPVAARAQVK